MSNDSSSGDTRNVETGEFDAPQPLPSAAPGGPAASDAGEDAAEQDAAGLDPILQVYSAGPTCVVGFGGRDVLDGVNLAVCRSEVLSLIKEHDSTAIAFDLTGVLLMPSGLLGLLASLRQEGVEVHIYNPSEDVREVLEVTHLDKVMQVSEVSVAADTTE